MKYFFLSFLIAFTALPTFAEKNALEVYKQIKNKPHALIDVRTPAEVSAEGMLKGALNIPLNVLDARSSEINKKAPVFVYCRSGSRAGQAAAILRKKGYEVHNLGAYSNLLKTLP